MVRRTEPTTPAGPVVDCRYGRGDTSVWEVRVRPADLAATSVSERYFETPSGITLAASVCGDPDGKPVLFLHGWGQTRHAWGRTLEELAARGWYAISLDLRGHGDSDWPDDPGYELDDFADDVLAVLEQLPPGASVVGASLGGISSLLAVTRPGEGRVDRLVLVDVTPRVETEGAWRVLEFMRSGVNGFGSLEEAAAAVAAYLPHRGTPRDPSGLERNLRADGDGRLRWHWDPRFLEHPWFAPPDRDTLASTIEGTRQRLLEAAARLEIPLLLVHGRLSDIVTDETAEELLRTAPDASYADVREAGHMVAGDVNDAFTSAITPFLQTRRR